MSTIKMFTLTTILLHLTFLTTPILSCSPSLLSNTTLHRRQTASGTPIYPALTTGTDGPARPSTLGFKLAHTALFVSSLNATKHFYGDILGMREIFRLDATSDYSIMYMAHAQGGQNGTGFMTGEEMSRELYNMAGLIEFISPKNSHRTYSPTLPQTYSHLGLIVPDLPAAQRYLIANNVPILKKIGQKPTLGGLCANVFGMAAQAVVSAMSGIGFEGLLVVQDPDGNVIEVLQQE